MEGLSLISLVGPQSLAMRQQHLVSLYGGRCVTVATAREVSGGIEKIDS